jgi:hypothetical protein
MDHGSLPWLRPVRWCACRGSGHGAVRSHGVPRLLLRDRRCGRSSAVAGHVAGPAAGHHGSSEQVPGPLRQARRRGRGTLQGGSRSRCPGNLAQQYGLEQATARPDRLGPRRWTRTRLLAEGIEFSPVPLAAQARGRVGQRQVPLQPLLAARAAQVAQTPRSSSECVTSRNPWRRAMRCAHPSRSSSWTSTVTPHDVQTR